MAATAAQNRLFLVSLGVGAFLSITFMRRLLIHYRDLSIIPESEGKSQYITQEVEDSLKLSTLNKLLDSPNYSIQETTSVIVCERALHDGTTIDVLLSYITQPEHDVREKGIRALTMMINSSTVGMMNAPKTFSALVKSLEYCVTDYEHNEYDPEWDNWNLRDVVEQGCLLVLGQMIEKFGLEGLIKTRFVGRWLAKEPWSRESDDHRKYNFLESMTKGYRLSNICLRLYQHPEGRKQLEEARLVPLRKKISPFKDSTRDVRMVNGESTAGEDTNELGVDSRRRRDQSSEEEHLRRRHREAMVLNDGTRPLARSDIFQRER